MQGAPSRHFVVAAARGLAIERDKARGVRPTLRDPGLETGGKQRRINAVHDHPQPVLAGNAVVEFRHGTQEFEVRLAPIGDVLVIVTVGDRAADDKQNDLMQRIHDLPGLAAVLDGRKMIEETAKAWLGQNVQHGELPNRKAHGITPAENQVASIHTVKPKSPLISPRRPVLGPTLHGTMYCTLAAGKRWIEAG